MFVNGSDCMTHIFSIIVIFIQFRLFKYFGMSEVIQLDTLKTKLHTYFFL